MATTGMTPQASGQTGQMRAGLAPCAAGQASLPLRPRGHATGPVGARAYRTGVLEDLPGDRTPPRRPRLFLPRYGVLSGVGNRQKELT